MMASELITLLLEATRDGDEDLEVKLATQPSWPLAADVRGVVAPDERELDPTDVGHDVRERADVLWIVAGDAGDYAPGDVFEIV